MKKYVVLYESGYNVFHWIVEAASTQDAIQKFDQEATDDWDADENGRIYWTYDAFGGGVLFIYELGEGQEINMDEYVEKVEATKEGSENEAKERQEYERLKKKFE